MTPQHRCHYCGVPVMGRARCTDHFIPRSKGGADSFRNLVVACNVCNSIKGDRTFERSRFRLVQKMIGWPKFSLEQLEWLRDRGFDMAQFDAAQLWFER